MVGVGCFLMQLRVCLIVRFLYVRVEPRCFEWGGEVVVLHEGECDVVFVWLFVDLMGLMMIFVVFELWFVGFVADHRLVGRDLLCVDELDDEFIFWICCVLCYWVDWWVVNLCLNGVELRWGFENDNVEEMLE